MDRAIPWIVALAASLFVLLVEIRVAAHPGPVSDWAWRLTLLAAIYIFTFFVFSRIRTLEQQRQGEADRCRVLFQRSRLSIAVFRSNCIIEEANDALLELSGWSREDLSGRKACSELLTADGDAEMLCAAICPSYWPDGQQSAPPTRLLLRCRDGSRVPVMVSLAPLPRSKNGEGFALFLWDVSDQEVAERDSALRRRQAEGLVAIAREIAAAPDLEGRMELVLERARGLLKMDLVAWGTLDEERQSLTWQAATGAGAYRLRTAQMALGDALMGRMLLQGLPYITMEIAREHAELPAIHELLSQPELRAAMAVPFPLRDQIHGVLLCASRERLSLTDEDATLFAHLGACLATALEKASLLAEVEKLATLQERQRLAAEMHDGLGQILTYLGLRLHMISKYAARGEAEEVQAEVAGLQAVIQEAHTEVRTAIFRLKESAPPRSPLSVRWRKLLDDFAARTGILVTYQPHPGLLDRLPEHKEAQLTRILQEALVNVRNHSGAYSVQVRVERDGFDLALTVSDDGCGFDPGAVAGAQQHHFGLTLIRERAESMGGHLDLVSMRGCGTTVLVRCPLDMAEEDSA